MNKIGFIIAFAMFFISTQAQQQEMEKAGNGFFMNPVFAGDYPDPSILRDGGDYYIVHSSFEYYPGLLIWHSTDLINWAPVTNALHKYVGSVYAPDLVKHNNKFYIYFPANGTNFVVWANSINGPWSEPIDLKIGNIDPGHVTDKKGNRYLYFSNGGYVPLSKDGLSVTGKLMPSYQGWEIPSDWSIECFCLEGPKLVKKGKYYYLTVAEGGTAGPATGHMIISARSTSALGPWENSPFNPIARAKSKNERWWSQGHGTLFEGAHGRWWMLFHGYEKGFLNMGRQTLLQPVEWTQDDWFIIPKGNKLNEPQKLPKGAKKQVRYNISDPFKGPKLRPQWKFFEEYDTSRFTFSNNSLAIKGKGESVGSCSPLLTIPANHSYLAQVEINIEGDATAGLVLFYNNSAHSGILADSKNIMANLRGWQFTTEKNVINKHVYLRLKNINNNVDMYYSTNGKEWDKIESSLEVSSLNHNALNGFLSLRIGLCSIGKGVVKFKNFEYNPIK